MKLYTDTICIGRILSLLLSCFFIFFFYFVFILSGHILPFRNYMKKHWPFHSWQLTWSLLSLSNALFVLNIAHVGTIYSLKFQRNNYLCEGLRFLLASLVTHPLLSIYFTSLYIWLCIRDLWVGRFLFYSYLMYTLSTGWSFFQTGLYSVKFISTYLSLSSWQLTTKATLYPSDVSILFG